MHYRERMCPLCQGQQLNIAAKFRDAPLEDSLQLTSSKARELPRFPLTLVSCKSCGHVFVLEVADARESYEDYSFASALSPGLVPIIAGVAERVWISSESREGDLVVDVGSNDGTLLEHFRKLGATVLGVEPSHRHAHLATSRGIPTRQEYFGPASLQETGQNRPQVICFHNVLANLEDPISSLLIASEALSDGGTVSILTGYHPDQFRAFMFDWVYHEHLSYFSAHDIAAMSKASGFSVKHVSRLPYKGGSIHVILKKGRGGHSEEFLNLLAWERWSNSNSVSLITNMMKRVTRNRKKFSDYFGDNQKFIGYGSSHSTTTLALNLDIEQQLIALVDDNESRHGKFSPVGGLEVLPPSELLSKDSSVIILAWQHDFRIREKIQGIGYSGQVVSVLPEFSVRKV